MTIDASGIFSGRAWGDQIGWITYNCSTDTSCSTVDYKVSTDWRPQSSSARATPAVTSTSHSSSGSYIRGFGPVSVVVPQNIPQNIVTTKIATTSTGRISNIVKAITPPITPPSLKPNSKPVTSAPLPAAVRALIEKFPQLQKTFNSVGIRKLNDLGMLSGAKFVLPSISKEVGIAGGASVPIARLTATQKKMLPTDIVFAKAGSLLDYSIFLTISSDGTPSQEINTVVGKPIELAVKADKPVKSIKGYLTVKNLERQSARQAVPARSQLAAPIMAILALGSSAGNSRVADTNNPNAKNVNTAVLGTQIENKLVLQQFEYTDPNNDGIYTASISAPAVHGEYDIVSVMEYKDQTLGKKELHLTAVVDPEGYIYEKIGNKEMRIPDAKVTLLSKNSQSGLFESWRAMDYQQVNPQKTDKSGTYSFLVPEGEYMLTVSAPGYYDYSGQPFIVQEGHNVHEDIALIAKSWWRTLLGLH